MLIGAAVLFGGIFAYKVVVSYFIKRYIATMINQPATVSTTKAQRDIWYENFTAVGSLAAIEGVSVTTEAEGMIRTINFNSGDTVKEGDILVELNIDPEKAQLMQLEANADLANVNYERDKAQFAVKAVSQSTIDTDLANLKSVKAQVEQQKALIAKKVIRAPFSGRLGIRQVNIGQYIHPGDSIVTLQSLDPIYVNFYLPQKNMVELKNGQQIDITVDTYPGRRFSGKVTSINPLVDTATRNVEIQATINNPTKELIPGMYAATKLLSGRQQQYITLPKTAISFNSYGELIYLIKQDGKNQDGTPKLIVNEKFIKTGASRGDQIAILEGVNVGDEIVTAGQLKLKKGSWVKINNKIQTNNNPAPQLENE